MTEAEYTELKTLKRLGDNYALKGMDALSEPELRMLRRLEEKWFPIDKTQILFDEIDRLESALREIKQICNWYAFTHKGPDNEVHHALKVELLDLAEKALSR